MEGMPPYGASGATMVRVRPRRNKARRPSLLPLLNPEQHRGRSDGSIPYMKFICCNCSTPSTTLCREYVQGSLLCNACGLYWQLYGRHRSISTVNTPSSGTTEMGTSDSAAAPGEPGAATSHDPDAIAGAPDLLEGIDSVPWASLQHAKGPAVDVPTCIRQLQYSGPGGGSQATALTTLSSSLEHRGTRYEASARAVPFLLKLLDDVRTPKRNDIIFLLIEIAVGDPHDWEPGNIDVKSWREGAGETDWGLQSYDAVREGIPVLEDLMHRDPVAIVQATCAYALAWFPEAACPNTQNTLASIWYLVDIRGGDPSAKATAVVAVGLLTAGITALVSSDGEPHRHDPETISRLLALHREDSTASIVRWAAAKVLLDLDAEDPEAILTIAEAAINTDHGWELATSWGDDICGYSEATLDSFARRKTNGAASSSAVEAVVDALSRSEGHVAYNIADMAMQMVFTNNSQPLLAFGEMQDKQQRVIRVVAAAGEDVWAGADFHDICRRRGLPGDRAALREYAALSS